LVVVLGVQNPVKDGMRLIEFNETYRVWLTQQEVEKLLNECGKPDQTGRHTGFMDITDHPNLRPQFFDIPEIPTTITMEPLIRSMIQEVDPSNLKDSIEKLSSFWNRYYTTDDGRDSALWIQSKFQSYIDAAENPHASVQLFEHSWKQPSVIARIEGETSDSIVIIGAHEDSIGGGSASIAPGADDDATGTATVLEIFRVLVSNPAFKPRLSIEFQTYSAEEVGLRGSQDIASSYQKQKISVAGMLQFDMTAYPGQPAIVTDFVNPQLTSYVKDLARTFTHLNWIESKCGYGCSDHASWTKAGYPSAFPFETSFSSSNRNIHTSNDILAHLDLEKGAQFANLGIAFALEMTK
jgi:leucyl aminopeptidase